MRPEETRAEWSVPPSLGENTRPPAEGPVRKSGGRCGEGLGVFAVIIQKLEKKDDSVAELRVEVGIENCPDGAGEGKVRGGGPAKQLTRLEGEGRSTFPSLSKYCQVEEGVEG